MSTSKSPTPQTLSRRANSPGPPFHSPPRVRSTPPDSQAAPPPAPGSTIHSLGTEMVFGSDRGAGPADHPGGASERGPSTTDAPAFLGRAQTRTTLRSHRQPGSMQDSNAVTATSTGDAARREPATDRITAQVSSSAHATSSASSPFLPFPSIFHVWIGAAKASAIGGLANPFLLPRHRMPACVPPYRHRPSSDLPACTSNSCTTRPGSRVSTSIYFPSSFSPTCLSGRFSISMPYIS
jgi:hypothetical protein